MTLHADIAQAAAETYVGLVEVGVGLIPGGGGTKEFTKRVSDALQEGDVELNALQNAFMTIATAKVALSAEEAREMGILRDKDRISINKDRQIIDAKSTVLELSDAGYTMPVQAGNIRVQGRTGMALFMAGMAIAEATPMTATVINNSINVNPRSFPIASSSIASTGP